MRTLAVFLLVVALSASMCATISVPDDLKKVVVFIYREGNTPGHYIANGTGFLVAVPSTTDKTKGYGYLVTAKHVLPTDSNNLASPLYSRIFLRLNRKPNGSETLPLDIVSSGTKQNVFFHSDDSVDIAVIPIGFDTNVFDALVLPFDVLATAKDIAENHIGVGTDVFFEGMFTPFLGQQKSYPIARFGRVAMLPDEKIHFNGQEIDAYLVETFAFGGNSGSPVFFYLGSDRNPGQMVLAAPTLKLAGVMKGYFYDIEPIKIAQPVVSADQGVPISTANAGIAVVVPAQKLRDILESPALASLRH
jgi:hypothetical protein